MTEGDEQLRAVLDGYATFLAERDLALPKHQPYLVRWVREFLRFARAHGGYTFEQTLDLFLAEIGGRAGVKPRQIQQAADAVRSYRACSRPNRPFPRCHALPALPTLPPADELPAPAPTRVDYPEATTSAVAALKAPLVFLADLSVRSHAHRLQVRHRLAPAPGLRLLL